VMLAAALVYWRIYVGVGLTHLLNPSLGALPENAWAPRRLIPLARHHRGVPVLRYKELPLLWRTPLSTTIYRLRYVAILLAYALVQIYAAQGAVVATERHYAPLAYGIDVTVILVVVLCTPILMAENRRRHVDVADAAAIVEDLSSRRSWWSRVPSIALGVIFLAVSGVVLVQRAESFIGRDVTLRPVGSTLVRLPASSQTIYASCGDLMNCSSLTPGQIRVTQNWDHVSLPIIPDVGVDHESAGDHPWLSVATFHAPRRGEYAITLSGDPRGHFGLFRAQVDVLHALAPLMVETMIRLIGVGLGIAALWELAKRRRRSNVARRSRDLAQDG